MKIKNLKIQKNHLKIIQTIKSKLKFTFKDNYYNDNLIIYKRMLTPNQKSSFKINFNLKKKLPSENSSLTLSEKILLLANVSPEEICLFC